MREKILDVVKSTGPVLPVEIVSKTGGDSLVANAYLSDLVDGGQLKKSEERIGSVNLYFLEGQEDQVKKRLSELDINLTPRQFTKKPVIKTKEIGDKQKAFAERLSKIEEDENQRKKEKPKKSVISFTKNLISRAKEEVIIQKPNIELKKSVLIPVKPIISEEFDSFFDRAVSYLNNWNLKVINENSENNTCTIRAPSAVWPMRFHVRILDKKKLNKTDIAESYTAAIEKKMPVIVITSGEIAKTAKKYLKEIGGLVRVKALKI